MAKTEIYSWRLTPRLKSRLEEAARAERRSLAEVLGQATEEWLARHGERGDDDERQARIRAAASRYVGAIRGGRADRAQNAHRDVRTRLAARRGR
jgi:predicted transcriptional regulator